MMGVARKKFFSVAAASALIALITAVTLLFAVVPRAFAAEVDEPIISVASEPKLPEKALTGTEITLPAATAKKADNVTELPVKVRVTLNGSDVTKPDSIKYTLEKGLYNVYYEAYDADNGMYAFASYDIDVRDVWLTLHLEQENPETGFVGLPIEVSKAYAQDFEGNRLDSVSVTPKVSLGALPVTLNGQQFTPSLAGTYEVIYTAQKDGETQSIKAYIVVTGTKPALTVNNMPAEIYVGKEFTLPDASATDAGGGVIIVTVSVNYNGAKVTVTDNKFTPEKEGEYTITYVATNNLGIPSALELKVKCVKEPKKGCGCGSEIASKTAIGATVVLLIFGVAALIVRRRKIKNKSDINEVKR